MSSTVQYIIVGIIVAAAFALAARSIYRAITQKKSALNPCDSCKLKDNCKKKYDNCEVQITDGSVGVFQR
ncbi:MAG: FeoB-associated Cys-rich membrane protein [Muribaculaceae bacterium]|nr:FeoB-associated Cys-rich membrane protein [Muribaculaceae bacterium]